MKRQNGITLIALIITIIVLLILAGICLAFISGENGILARAIISREKTYEAQAKEMQDFDSMADSIERYGKNNRC